MNLIARRENVKSLYSNVLLRKTNVQNHTECVESDESANSVVPWVWIISGQTEVTPEHISSRFRLSVLHTPSISFSCPIISRAEVDFTSKLSQRKHLHSWINCYILHGAHVKSTSTMNYNTLVNWILRSWRERKKKGNRLQLLIFLRK